MIQKRKYEPNLSAVNYANPAVNRVNSKVNKAIIQSACGFHLRRQMASCVLSTSKHFQCLKTTCPRCFMQGEKRAPKSCVFDEIFDWTPERATGFLKKAYQVNFKSPPAILKSRRAFVEKQAGFYKKIRKVFTKIQYR